MRTDFAASKISAHYHRNSTADREAAPVAAGEGKRLILPSLPVRQQLPRPKLRIVAYIARTIADCIDDSAQQLQGMGRDSS